MNQDNGFNQAYQGTYEIVGAWRFAQVLAGYEASERLAQVGYFAQQCT